MLLRLMQILELVPKEEFEMETTYAENAPLTSGNSKLCRIASKGLHLSPWLSPWSLRE